MSTEIAPWKDALIGAQERFVAIAERDKIVEWQRESMFALQSLEKNDYLKRIASSNPASLRNAIINVAACGITLNPAAQYAALVPRDGAVCLDIMYRGLIKIATDMGSIRWVQAELVYSTDKFSYAGPTSAPIHEANVFAKDRGEIIGVYCIAKTVDGDFLTDTMSVDEVNEIRDRSSAWKAFVDKKTKSCPWDTDWGEMAKKTVIKRARKTWPESKANNGAERLQIATELANHADGYEPLAVESKPSGKILPSDGAMESLTPDQQEKVVAAVKQVQERLKTGTADYAWELWQSFGFDDTEQVAGWSLMPSHERTALRKADERARKAA